jgi:hypothetical protein
MKRARVNSGVLLHHIFFVAFLRGKLALKNP